MKGAKVIAAFAISSVMVVSGARSEIKPSGDESQYSTIGARNIFDLKPVPPPPANTGPAAPQVNVKLTGITTILGPKQAVFSVQQAGKPAPDSVVLGEGERQGGIEVASIDMQERTANVTIDGRPMTMHLEEGKGMGAAPAAAAAPPPGTTAAAQAALAPRGGGAAPPPQTFYGARGGGNTATPTSMPPNFNPNPAGVQPDPNAFSYGDPNTTARQLRTTTAAVQPNLTPDQQAVLIEAQREQALKTGNPIAPILPPTKFSSDAQQSGQPPQPLGFPPASTPPPYGQKVTGTYLPK